METLHGCQLGNNAEVVRQPPAVAVVADDVEGLGPQVTAEGDVIDGLAALEGNLGGGDGWVGRR